MSEQSRYPHLSSAPIEEAIISITIEKSKHPSLGSVKRIHQELENKYPKIHDHMLNIASFELNETAISTRHEKRIEGYELRSDSEKKILHINKDTLSLHHIKPYDSWIKFLSDYEHAWNIFTKSLQIYSISNISVRYINKFTIPMNNWTRHLSMRPILNNSNQYDDSPPIYMLDCFSRYIVRSEIYSAKSVVLFNMRIKQPASSELEVTMDIDAKSENQIVGYNGFSTINNVLTRLRAFKNQIFFSNVPTAKELFDDRN